MFALNSTIKINSLTLDITKWLNTLKQFVGNLSPHCLSVVDHFVGWFYLLKKLQRNIKIRETLQVMPVPRTF